MALTKLKIISQSPFFRAAYNEVLKAMKGLQPVEVVGLLGSARVQEAVIGYSDLDVLLLVEADDYGNISEKVRFDIGQRTQAIQDDYPDIPISVLLHTWNDLAQYVNFEYLRHYAKADIGYQDGVDFQQKIEAILLDSSDDPKTVSRYCVNQIRMFRFNVIRKVASGSPSLDALTKYCIDSLFEVIDFSLIQKGMWMGSKQELVKAAHSDLGLDEAALTSVYNLRSDWSHRTKAQMEKAVEKIPLLIQQVARTSIEMYPHRVDLR